MNIRIIPLSNRKTGHAEASITFHEAECSYACSHCGLHGKDLRQFRNRSEKCHKFYNYF